MQRQEKQRQKKYKGNAKLDAEVKIFAKINLSHYKTVKLCPGKGTALKYWEIIVSEII